MSNEITPLATEAVNEITFSNMRMLSYWLATVIVVVTASITGSIWDDRRDSEKHIDLRDTVSTLSATVTTLNEKQIRAEGTTAQNRLLHSRDQAENDRRFMELLRRIDVKLAGI